MQTCRQELVDMQAASQYDADMSARNLAHAGRHAIDNTATASRGDAVQVAGDHAELLAPALEVLQDRAADVSGGRGDNDHRSSPGCSVTDIAMLYISIDYRYTDLVASGP